LSACKIILLLLACVAGGFIFFRTGLKPAGDGRRRVTGSWQEVKNGKRLVFVFSTGRTQTKQFSRVFGGPGTYVNHQDESEKVTTREVVEKVFRPYARSNDTEMGRKFISTIKLPMIERRLRDANNAQVYFQTGHAPLAFGLGELIIEAVGTDAFSVVRLRRDRIPNALSMMALGPESEDPWAPVGPGGDTSRRRWFPKPTDYHVKLRPSVEVWKSFNRFQKYLWLVDDTECRWQSLKQEYAFDYMEVQMEALTQMNGWEEYKRIANFVGTDFVSNPEKLYARDNSIESKKRDHVKWVTDEKTLREWDEDYRKLVGPCILSSGDILTWQ